MTGFGEAISSLAECLRDPDPPMDGSPTSRRRKQLVIYACNSTFLDVDEKVRLLDYLKDHPTSVGVVLDSPSEEVKQILLEKWANPL